MITGERKPRKASLCLPPNWKEISEEVKELIEANYPDFATRPYFSVASIDWKFRQAPGQYPLLNAMSKSLRRRYVSRYLRLQGCIPRSSAKGGLHGCMTWMRPELVNA
jgi:hypothetical protein